MLIDKFVNINSWNRLLNYSENDNDFKVYIPLNYHNMIIALSIVTFPYGLVVRISGFHPDGPGSIPGVGMILVVSLAGV